MAQAAPRGDDHIAPVIQLRPLQRPPSCLICVHVVMGDHLTRCSLYQELIDAEASVAEDCEHYEDDPERE